MGKQRKCPDNYVSDTSWWVIGLVFLFTLLALFWYAFSVMMHGHAGWARPEIILSVLLVIGVVVLVLSLALTTVVFKSLGLTDRTQSLGLPEGSIRAVIALSLILIFMMTAAFLYMEVEDTDTYISSGISKEILDQMPKDDIVKITALDTPGNETVYEVTRVVKKDSASTDIAKQIITTMSTLVVAVAGFYFGTKAVSVAKGLPEEPGEEPTPPKPRVTPGEGQLGRELDLQIVGDYLDSAQKVRLVQGSAEIQATDVKAQGAHLVTCHIRIDEDKPLGTYTVIVTHTDGEEMSFDNAFTVKPQ